MTSARVQPNGRVFLFVRCVVAAMLVLFTRRRALSQWLIEAVLDDMGVGTDVVLKRRSKYVSQRREFVQFPA